jgi:hypothetical protein
VATASAEFRLEARLERLRSGARTYERRMAECEASGQERKADQYRLGLELFRVQREMVEEHQRLATQVRDVELALARTARGAPGAPRAPRRGHIGPTRRAPGARRSTTSSRAGPSELAGGDEPPGEPEQLDVEAWLADRRRALEELVAGWRA